jgi:DNA polymerase-3 subunit alpha (Gram-positive type)
LTVKGDNGVILTILPIKSPTDEINGLESFLQGFRWSQIHIRLCGPFIEGLFFLNSNFVKIPENFRKKSIEYLQKTHSLPDVHDFMDEKDFIITPHLINGQFIVYSFLNFSPYTQLIFKFPSHKKKLHQYLSGQILRYEGQQKSRKKIFIQKELKDIFLKLFSQALKEDPKLYLSLKINDIKNEKKLYLDRIEQLTIEQNDKYKFPVCYL